MKPLIQTPEDIARLRAIADSWVGTPWVADGAVKGTGVSCSMLPYAALAEYGHGAPLPPKRATITKREIFPLMERWVAEHPEFYVRVDQNDIRAGDVLIFYIGIGHMALAFGDGVFLHCWQTAGVHFSNLANGALSDRLKSVWRPIVGV
jgi:cell wall-associated NlpC family hydrolase